MVMKRDGTPLGDRTPAGDPSPPTKEASVELAEQLAKAQADLTAANAKIDELTKAVDDAKAAAAGDSTDPVAKALETLPPEVADMVRKSQTDAAEAVAKAQALEDAAATRTYIAKAGEITGLTIDAEKFGPQLRAVFEKAGPEVGEEIFRVLKSAGEIAAKSELFKSMGTGAVSAPNAYAAIEAAAAEIRKSNTSLTKEQAIAEAVRQNPELRAEYDRETNGRR